MSRLDDRASAIADDLNAHDTYAAVQEIRRELYERPESIGQVLKAANAGRRQDDSEFVAVEKGHIYVVDPWAQNEAIEAGPMPTRDNPRPLTSPPRDGGGACNPCGPDSEADDRDPDARFDNSDPSYDPDVMDPQADPGFDQRSQSLPTYEDDSYTAAPQMQSPQPNPFDVLGQVFSGIQLNLDLGGGHRHHGYGRRY